MHTTVHATAVAVDGHGVLLRGQSGAGKSDLALRLIFESPRGGDYLIADDHVVLTAQAGRLWAAPLAQGQGLLEVRGIGIVTLDGGPAVPLALVVDLCRPEQMERLPETKTVTLHGICLPLVSVDGLTASAPTKVRLALKIALGSILRMPI